MSGARRLAIGKMSQEDKNSKGEKYVDKIDKKLNSDSMADEGCDCEKSK